MTTYKRAKPKPCRTKFPTLLTPPKIVRHRTKFPKTKPKRTKFKTFKLCSLKEGTKFQFSFSKTTGKLLYVNQCRAYVALNNKFKDAQTGEIFTDVIRVNVSPNAMVIILEEK